MMDCSGSQPNMRSNWIVSKIKQTALAADGADDCSDVLTSSMMIIRQGNITRNALHTSKTNTQRNGERLLPSPSDNSGSAITIIPTTTSYGNDNENENNERIWKTLSPFLTKTNLRQEEGQTMIGLQQQQQQYFGNLSSPPLSLLSISLTLQQRPQNQQQQTSLSSLSSSLSDNPLLMSCLKRQLVGVVIAYSTNILTSLVTINNTNLAFNSSTSNHTIDNDTYVFRVSNVLSRLRNIQVRFYIHISIIIIILV